MYNQVTENAHDIVGEDLATYVAELSQIGGIDRVYERVSDATARKLVRYWFAKKIVNRALLRAARHDPE